MGRKMSIAKQIKVQKLQTRNRMVGQTFNPSGHTSESLAQREQEYIDTIKNMSDEEQEKLFKQFRSIEIYKSENNIYISNCFEHNCFMRNFGYKFK